MLNFVAIDFETANKYKNSACSLAAVTVENGQIVKRAYSLIKPPFMQFDDECIEIHGIYPKDVMEKPTFDELWPRIYENHLKGKLVIAHNAKFDIGVLRATLDYYNIIWPELDYTCTVKISRKVWPNLANHKLNTLGAFLNVKFKHHDALEDALTCAKVAIAAAQEMHVDSMNTLLSSINLEKEQFVTDPAKAMPKQPVNEQTSFF